MVLALALLSAGCAGHMLGCVNRYPADTGNEMTMTTTNVDGTVVVGPVHLGGVK